SIQDHIERLMPRGGRIRLVVGWGVVAWAGIGVGLLLVALGLVLGRVAGVVPYLVVAMMLVFLLNPAVVRLTARGVPRRVAAVILFVAGMVVPAVAAGLLVPAAIPPTQGLVHHQ